MHRALALLLNILIAPLNTAFTPLGTMSHANSPLNDAIGAGIDRAESSMFGLGLGDVFHCAAG
jgi:hypothetical protein